MRVLRVSHSAVVDAWRERERSSARAASTSSCSCRDRWDEGGTEVPLRRRPGEPVTASRTSGRHPALFVYDPRPLWTRPGSSRGRHRHPRGAVRPRDRGDPAAAAAAPAAGALLALLRAEHRQALSRAFRWLERWALRHAVGRQRLQRARPGASSSARASRAGRAIPLGVDTAASPGRAPQPRRRIRCRASGRLRRSARTAQGGRRADRGCRARATPDALRVAGRRSAGGSAARHRRRARGRGPGRVLGPLGTTSCPASIGRSTCWPCRR